jgi:hypothetical protein
VSFHFVIKELQRRQFARIKERRLIARPQRSCRSNGVPLVQRLAAVLRYGGGDVDDRDPAEGEVKEKDVRPRQNAQRGG